MKRYRHAASSQITKKIESSANIQTQSKGSRIAQNFKRRYPKAYEVLGK